MSGPILVVGATGRQGGAVARHLLARKRSLRALTRNPDGAAARALAGAGAELVRGDLEDLASLERATAGVGAVFSVQDPWLHGVAAEIRQGKLLADAARKAGVTRVVYASVGTAGTPSGVEHFESKGTIEAYMRELGLRVTSIRPTLFMEALLPHWDARASFTLGALKRGLRGGKVQLTAVDDIGRVAADAFEAPDDGKDHAVEIAGDEPSFSEIIQTFVRIIGRKPRVVDVPFTLLRLFSHEAYVNFRWIGEAGWHFDLEALRAERPWLSTFEAWLRAQHEQGHTDRR